jgi:hypothetical protein
VPRRRVELKATWLTGTRAAAPGSALRAQLAAGCCAYIRRRELQLLARTIPMQCVQTRTLTHTDLSELPEPSVLNAVRFKQPLRARLPQHLLRRLTISQTV